MMIVFMIDSCGHATIENDRIHCTFYNIAENPVESSCTQSEIAVAWLQYSMDGGLITKVGMRFPKRSQCKKKV